MFNVYVYKDTISVLTIVRLLPYVLNTWSFLIALYLQTCFTYGAIMLFKTVGCQCSH